MARIDIVDGQLHVRMQGVHRVLAFKSAVTVPLEHVRSVTVRPDLRQWVGWKLLRLPGTAIPGVIIAGSYYRIGDGWYFFDVRDPQRSIAINLTDEHYKTIVVQVDEETPEAAARRIEAALRAAGHMP